MPESVSGASLTVVLRSAALEVRSALKRFQLEIRSVKCVFRVFEILNTEAQTLNMNLIRVSNPLQLSGRPQVTVELFGDSFSFEKIFQLLSKFSPKNSAPSHQRNCTFQT